VEAMPIRLHSGSARANLIRQEVHMLDDAVIAAYSIYGSRTGELR
jgi:hypothetical protein